MKIFRADDAFQVMRKISVFSLLIVLPLTLFAIALDQHFQGFSQKCLICKSKTAMIGLEASSALDFFPAITHFASYEILIKLRKLNLLAFQNKSPPVVLTLS